MLRMRSLQWICHLLTFFMPSIFRAGEDANVLLSNDLPSLPYPLGKALLDSVFSFLLSCGDHNGSYPQSHQYCRWAVKSPVYMSPFMFSNIAECPSLKNPLSLLQLLESSLSRKCLFAADVAVLNNQSFSLEVMSPRSGRRRCFHLVWKFLCNPRLSFSGKMYSRYFNFIYLLFNT